MAADLGSEGLTPALQVGGAPKIRTLAAMDMPEVGSEKAVALNSIFGRRYSVYWKE
jgi:hypothetical protein